MVSFGYKFRIYPMAEQKTFFEKHFGCCRFIYNYLLALRNESYKKFKISISGFEAKKQMTTSKRENYLLRIPKLKSLIRVNVHRPIDGTIKQITIVKEASGEYFACFNCEVKKESIFTRENRHDGEVGIDLGLTSFLTISTGEKIEAPQFLRKLERRLKAAQRSLSRKKKYSLNWYKVKGEVASLHQRIACCRKDFLHKISFKLVDENQVIYLEDLNVKGMMKNRRLSKSIADASWGEFARQLKYKAAWRRKMVIQIGRFEPSSKLCSLCGFKNNDLQLHQREWLCKACGSCHDRDINAAKNIVKLGQGMPNVKSVEKPTAVFSLKKKQVDSMKQKPIPGFRDAR